LLQKLLRRERQNGLRCSIGPEFSQPQTGLRRTSGYRRRLLQGGGRRSLATGSLAPLDWQLTLGIRPESLPGADDPALLVATARASSDAIQSPWSGDAQVTDWAARAEAASSSVVAPEMLAQAASSDASAATAAASAAETGTDWRSWTVLFSAVALGSGIYLTRPPGVPPNGQAETRLWGQRPRCASRQDMVRPSAAPRPARPARAARW
jgi:hypothetical protein